MSYTLLCGLQVVGICETRRSVVKALRHFSPNVGIKVRQHYRPKKAPVQRGTTLAQSCYVSDVARRGADNNKYVRLLRPGEFKL